MKFFLSNSLSYPAGLGEGGPCRETKPPEGFRLPAAGNRASAGHPPKGEGEAGGVGMLRTRNAWRTPYRERQASLSSGQLLRLDSRTCPGFGDLLRVSCQQSLRY